MSALNENKAVGSLAGLLAAVNGASPGMARQIRSAAALHDIGKQKLPRELLDKPGKLEPHEFEIIKTHTTIGEQLLESVQGSLGEIARNCARWHHEWHNGGGYFGRRMSDLPFYVAYVSLADVFVALLSVRPYKDAWPSKDAVDYIQSRAGTQFAPELVKPFLWLVQNDNRVPAALRVNN